MHPNKIVKIPTTVHKITPKKLPFKRSSTRFAKSVPNVFRSSIHASERLELDFFIYQSRASEASEALVSGLQGGSICGCYDANYSDTGEAIGPKLSECHRDIWEIVYL